MVTLVMEMVTVVMERITVVIDRITVSMERVTLVLVNKDGLVTVMRVTEALRC